MSSVDFDAVSPRKRQKLSSPPRQDPAPSSTLKGQLVGADVALQTKQQLWNPNPMAGTSFDQAQLKRELEVGITEYVDPQLSRFSGILKKRYTDFLVNEILLSGQVVHLDELKPPRKQQPASRAPEIMPLPSSSTGHAREPPAEVLQQSGSGPQASEEAKTHASNQKEPTAAQLNGVDASSVKQPNEFKLSPENETELQAYFGADGLRDVLSLYREVLAAPHAKPRNFRKIKSPVITDRVRRTKLHHLVRQVFSSRLDTSTDDDGAIVVSCASQVTQSGRGSTRQGRESTQARTRPGWKDLGGEHLHFSLYKENKDTMEIISFLARQLRVQPKCFQFAGTKDRRAVSVQRVSAYRVLAERLAGMNRNLRGSRVGNFEYMPRGLELGELAGNEFVITLRECRAGHSGDSAVGVERIEDRIAAAQIVVKSGLTSLQSQGFINYFGSQRFGTFSARTDSVGLRMLQGNFRAACEEIMSYNEETLVAANASTTSGAESRVASDDKARAQALHLFRAAGNSAEALEALPYKFSAETALIRYLGHKDRANDFQGALQTIPRNLRIMYVHAYQSLVWNFVAGERWRRFGAAVVAGDLVLVDGHVSKDKEAILAAMEEVDEHGEAVVLPAADDRAASTDDRFTRARALAQEEVDSGKYSIYDIVLPTPGFDILYPANDLADYYKTFMASEQGGGLDPFDMRRSWKDISLSGNYRKLLARPLLQTGVEFDIKAYERDDEQMVETDLEKLQKSSGERGVQDPANVPSSAPDCASKLAVILKLQLGTSQYATMALRELMGSAGVQTYKPDFGSGR